MERVPIPKITPTDYTTPDFRFWLWLVAHEIPMEQESHRIGERTDEQGETHQVWQHTFTPIYDHYDVTSLPGEGYHPGEGISWYQDGLNENDEEEIDHVS